MTGVGGLSATLLAGSTMLLTALTVATARRPPAPIPSQAEYLRRWSAVHGGYDPASSIFVSGWLRVAFVVARPLAGRGVQPDVVTA